QRHDGEQSKDQDICYTHQQITDRGLKIEFPQSARDGPARPAAGEHADYDNDDRNHRSRPEFECQVEDCGFDVTQCFDVLVHGASLKVVNGGLLQHEMQLDFRWPRHGPKPGDSATNLQPATLLPASPEPLAGESGSWPSIFPLRPRAGR